MKKLVFAMLFGSMVLSSTGSADGEPGNEGTGGGNILGGRLVESYHKPIERLSGYTQMVKPVLDSLKSKVPNLGKYFSAIALDTDFYLIPSELRRQSEHITGLPFPSDQGAVQKLGEVWVDQDLFNAMDVNERGKLIIHEIVLSAGFRLWPGADIQEVMHVVRRTTNFLADHYLDDADTLSAGLAEAANWGAEKLLTAKEISDAQDAKNTAERQSAEQIRLIRLQNMATFHLAADTYFARMNQFCATSVDLFPVTENEWSYQFNQKQKDAAVKAMSQIYYGIFFSDEGKRSGMLTLDEYARSHVDVREILAHQYSSVVRVWIKDVVNWDGHFVSQILGSGSINSPHFDSYPMHAVVPHEFCASLNAHRLQLSRFYADGSASRPGDVVAK